MWRDVVRTHDRDLVSLATCWRMTICRALLPDSDVPVSSQWLSRPISAVTTFGLSHVNDHVTMNIINKEMSAVLCTMCRQFTADQFTPRLLVIPASLLPITVTFSLTVDRLSTSEYQSLLQPPGKPLKVREFASQESVVACSVLLCANTWVISVEMHEIIPDCQRTQISCG